jgi:hypothetical protein
MPAKSKKQQSFFAMVRLCQETGKCASEKIKNVAKNITKKAAHDYAATDTKNLPDKKECNMSFTEFLESQNSEHGCTCPCASCLRGDCGGCTCENCTCKGCHCNSKS